MNDRPLVHFVHDSPSDWLEVKTKFKDCPLAENLHNIVMSKKNCRGIGTKFANHS